VRDEGDIAPVNCFQCFSQELIGKLQLVRISLEEVFSKVAILKRIIFLR